MLLHTHMGIKNDASISVMIPGETGPGSPGEHDLWVKLACLKFISPEDNFISLKLTSPL